MIDFQKYKNNNLLLLYTINNINDLLSNIKYSGKRILGFSRVGFHGDLK